MSSIEALKEQARNHEMKEEWRKALSLYLKAIEKLAEEDQPDIGLYNRVGDLYIRVGETDEAVAHYEEAVDLYVETELPNNAIAVCKKIIRNVPDQHRPYLRMGQIRAGQGFLVDARTNFLTYAERMQGDGEYDEAFRALTEFADLVPDDTDVRLMIAEQMQSHERPEEAVEQLIVGYRAAHDAGDPETIEVFEAKLREADPELDLSSLLATTSGDDEFAFESTALGGEDAVAYGEVSFDAPGAEVEGVSVESADEMADEPAATDEAADVGAAEAPDEFEPDEEEDALAAAGIDLDEDVGSELPMMSFDDDEADEAEIDEAGFAAAGYVEADFDDVEFGDDAYADVDDDGYAAADFDEVEFDEEGVAAEGDLGEEAEPEPTADLSAMEFAGFALDPVEGDDEGIDEGIGDEGIGGELPLLSFDDDDDGEHAEVDVEVAPGDGLADDEPEFDDVGLPLLEADVGMGDPVDEAADAVAEAREEAAGDRDDDWPRIEGPTAPVADAPDDEPASPAEELDALQARLPESPDDVDLHQRAVELAFRTGDDTRLARAYADLGHALMRTGSESRARAVFQQALDADPELEDAREALLEGDAPSAPVKEVASSDDYVDLGAMILGEDSGEKTTRFKVAYEAPSGDEDADFAKMLSQFKAKVAENFDATDVKAHHDLGTAYKEMGLLDEAIEEFQAALRASAEHLPTYELLGQVFLEQGNADAALRVLKRAQDASWEVEDELIGIYYYTARAHEELGQRDDAMEYYDRVFSLDINFADVTERLRRLR